MIDIKMLELSDIPTSWYAKLGVAIFRILRRFKLQKITRETRNRLMLGVIAKLHLESIHQIRNFSINRSLSGNLDNPNRYQPFEDVANACRSVLAEILELSPRNLHCTIKVIEDEQSNKENWKVYTIARSSDSNRELSPNVFHLIGHNSSFAPLVGCNDRKNTWIPSVYSCFACNNLVKNINRYDNSRTEWHSYYKATLVFPLRYRKIGETKVLGFLTFDSPQKNIFGNIPDIFDYKDNRSTYEELLAYSSTYHIGGILADILSTTFLLQYEMINGRGVYE